MKKRKKTQILYDVKGIKEAVAENFEMWGNREINLFYRYEKNSNKGQGTIIKCIYTFPTGEEYIINSLHDTEKDADDFIERDSCRKNLEAIFKKSLYVKIENKEQKNIVKIKIRTYYDIEKEAEQTGPAEKI